MILSGSKAGKEVPWEQRRFDIGLDDGPDFVVGSLLRLSKTLRAQPKATDVPTLLTFVTSDTSLDQIDQLLDHSDLVFLWVLDLTRLEALSIELVHKVVEELVVNGVD